MKKYFKQIEVDQHNFANIYYVLCDGKQFGICELYREEAERTAKFCRKEKGENHRIEIHETSIHIHEK